MNMELLNEKEGIVLIKKMAFRIKTPRKDTSFYTFVTSTFDKETGLVSQGFAITAIPCSPGSVLIRQ